MKKFIALTLAFMAISVCAKADVGFSVFATPGTAINPATNYAIVPTQSRNGGEPLVTYVNTTSVFSTGTASLTSYVSTNQTLEAPTLTNSTTTLYVNSTNGFVAGQWVVIQHLWMNLPRFQNEAAVISAVQNTNQIVLVTAPVNAVLPGDVINQETAWASIPLTSSASPSSINGPGIFSGQRNEPFLFVAAGTGASSADTNIINTINAVYQP